MTRPLILVSNDDGVAARGIEVLATAAADYGDVIVCAPDGEQSAMSHAITLHANLRVREVRENWYAVTGTPVDSVYLGSLHLCPRPPDIVLSGINDGYNLGTDVLYSGTVEPRARPLARPGCGLSVKSACRMRPSCRLCTPWSRAHRASFRRRATSGQRQRAQPPDPDVPMPLEVVRPPTAISGPGRRREDLMGALLLDRWASDTVG